MRKEILAYFLSQKSWSLGTTPTLKVCLNSTPLSEIVLEIDYRGHSFEVKHNMIAACAIL